MKTIKNRLKKTSGFCKEKCLIVLLFLVSSALNATAVTNTWAVDSDGLWTNVVNWAGAEIPTNAGDVAKLTYAITADRTVTLNTPVKVGSLLMSINSKGFLLATSGSGSLTLDNGSEYALVKSGPGSGRNKANITLILKSDLDVVNATGAYFDIGPFSGTNNIHINRTTGTGTAYVGGPSPDFTGNWFIYAGTLMFTGESFGSTGNGIRTITLFNNAILRNNGNAALYANRRIVIDASGGVIMPNIRTMSLSAADQFAGTGNLNLSDTGNYGGSFALYSTNNNFTGSIIAGAGTVPGNFFLGATGSINNSPLILLTNNVSALVVTNKAGGYNVPSGQTVAGVGCVRGQLNLLTTGAQVHPGIYTLPGPVSTPGILTVTNGLTLANGGTYLWDIKTLKDNATGVAGTDFARLDVPQGSASLSGGVLTLGFVGTAANNGPNSTNQFWRTEHTWTILTAASPPSGKLSISNGNYDRGVFVTQVNGNTVELVYKRGLDLTLIVVR